MLRLEWSQRARWKFTSGSR